MLLLYGMQNKIKEIYNLPDQMLSNRIIYKLKIKI